MAVTARFLAWAERVELHKFFDDVESNIDALEKAVTIEDKRIAARKFSDLLNKLG
jgi:hypothetical protein